jgi:hypothetical protein
MHCKDASPTPCFRRKRYKQWKTLDLMIFPLNLLGR